MSVIKFYSEHDIASGWELQKIVKKINNNVIDSEWKIIDLLNFYNILKYIKVEKFSNYIIQETGVDIKIYEKEIKQRNGKFIGCHKGDFLNLFSESDNETLSDFFEVIESYKIYRNIDTASFMQFIEKQNIHISVILMFKGLTEYFNDLIKDEILSEPRNAEVILLRYLQENDLYLPSSLTETDILNLIDEYIDLPLVDTNILWKIINFPTNKGLRISDKIKLHAKRRVTQEEEKIFKDEIGFKSGVGVSYSKEQSEEILITGDGRNIELKISRRWIEDNLDYPTLWNNFIYLFGFVDEKMRFEFDSKKSEGGVFENIFRQQAPHLYYEHSTFYYKKMLSNVVMHSYVNVLNTYGVRFEEMIEWFFDIYIKSEFKITNFIVKMPSKEASYFEKCRIILPEIDRIFKQYNTLIEDGMIDQELIQISSSSVKIGDIRSFNEKKYVYASSEWCKTASFLLFSEKSNVFYLSNKEKYKNFFDLMISKKITRNDFRENQLKKIQWLFDNKLIYEDKKGYFEFVDQKLIYILEELFYKEVISYWHYPKDIKLVIEELINRNLVCIESSLFSRNEQDYFDYYLNKSKFTNGHDIRNKYLHGTNSNDEEQYMKDYYTILKLFVVIIIKINDDLCTADDKENNR